MRGCYRPVHYLDDRNVPSLSVESSPSSEIAGSTRIDQELAELLDQPKLLRYRDDCSRSLRRCRKIVQLPAPNRRFALLRRTTYSLDRGAGNHDHSRVESYILILLAR
jgi:hypothetical protein